jgi:hypothetical protein
MAKRNPGRCNRFVPTFETLLPPDERRSPLICFYRWLTQHTSDLWLEGIALVHGLRSVIQLYVAALSKYDMTCRLFHHLNTIHLPTNGVNGQSDSTPRALIISASSGEEQCF